MNASAPRFIAPRCSRIGLALVAGLALGRAWASPAPSGGCGHDPKLDQADDHLVKAFALVSAAENPFGTPPFGGHDERAMRLIQRARVEVALAIEYSEQSCR
jgi:hypothetical protein